MSINNISNLAGLVSGLQPQLVSHRAAMSASAMYQRQHHLTVSYRQRQWHHLSISESGSINSWHRNTVVMASAASLNGQLAIISVSAASISVTNQLSMTCIIESQLIIGLNIGISWRHSI